MVLKQQEDKVPYGHISILDLLVYALEYCKCK